MSLAVVKWLFAKVRASEQRTGWCADSRGKEDPFRIDMYLGD